MVRLVALLFISLVWPNLPCAKTCRTDEHGKVQIVEWHGDVAILDDGRLIELAGLEIIGRPPIVKHEAAILLGPLSPTRHGTWRGDLWIAEKSLSAELVRAGIARVRPRAGDPACFPKLLSLENDARRAKRGLWQDADNQILPADDPMRLLFYRDRFVIIQGRVIHVGQGKDRIWIDFGPIWRTDVTVAVLKWNKESFAEAGLSKEMLEGQILRVRGIVMLRNGPYLEVTEPAAIERVVGEE